MVGYIILFASHRLGSILSLALYWLGNDYSKSAQGWVVKKFPNKYFSLVPTWDIHND